MQAAGRIGGTDLNEIIVALITKAKETIRDQYPDEEGGS